jgi:neutral amino acid transport system permease protein
MGRSNDRRAALRVPRPVTRSATRTTRRWIWLLLAAVAAATAVLAAPPTAGAQEPTTTTASGGGGDASVRGVLWYREDGERVNAEGVALSIESADGLFTDSTVTAANGSYMFQVPAAGAYTVTIDPDTIPEGVSLADEDRTSVDINVIAGRSNPVAFDFTTGDEQAGRSFLTRALRLGVQGIRFGLILAMCSVGLSLIFGTTGLVNFSHGELVTFGALIAFLFNVTFGFSMLIAAPLAVVAGGLLGGAFNRGIWRPLRNRGTGLVAMLVVSIGIGMFGRYIFIYQFGANSRGYEAYRSQTVVDLGPVQVVPRDLWIIGLSVVLLVAVALFLQLTLAGKAMRAVADDRELAEASGINVERVISWVWISGGALAAVGGVFNALAEDLSWQMGFQLLLLMFAAVILGGIGTAFGALVGGVAIGMFIQLSTLYIDSVYKTSAALLVLVLVLLVRPQGILGQAERIG